MELQRVCEQCGARWLEGRHYWATGQLGNELDLAGLVCNSHGSDACINPKRGQEGGVTWEERRRWIDEQLDTMQQRLDGLWAD